MKAVYAWGLSIILPVLGQIHSCFQWILIVWMDLEFCLRLCFLSFTHAQGGKELTPRIRGNRNNRKHKLI